MGCDIHIRIERRVSGQWVDVLWLSPNDYRWNKRIWQPGELLLSDEFDNRNYDLFGILANVRNGTWGEEHQPIAEPRGWPTDSPTDPRADLPDDDGYRWCGGHSFSWVTLAELHAYPWDAPIRKRGWVSHEEAAKFRADGIPPECYSASGNHGEYVEWTETVRDDVRDWPTKFLPLLDALGAPEDVRLCFGFDS